MNKLTEWLTKPFLDENVDLPINIGDTIKMGKFKNKKVVVKKIDWNEKGDLLINGRPALKFRLMPKTNIFDKEEVTEGTEDPGIFKAVFLAGGPGSGKTFVSRQLFGMPDSINISMSGMKMVNSDKELKHLLTKYGFGTDLDKMPDELFNQLTNPKDKDYSGLRTHSKELTTQRMKLYRKGRLGMIIDGTGHKWKVVRKQKQELEKLGYDTYMIFVDTSLEVAQKRNQERDRILPPDLLEKSWRDVQKNRGAFKSLFKNNFIEIQNNETLSDTAIEKKFGSLTRKYITTFMKRPIKSKIAKGWIKKQQILKKKGIKEGISKIKKVVGIYGGRFQPFGPHHKKTYEWLKKQVDDAYITTSNIKQPPRHPMNFKEKVRHMGKMGIPKNRIIQEKSPYVAKNVLSKYDKDTTAVIYIFGKKDVGRLKGGKYFKDYKKNKNNMSGFEEAGYILTAPHVSVNVGGKEVSGTVMRQLLGSPDYEKDREKLFKKAFGYFDKGVYTMMVNKFKKLFENKKLSSDLIEEFLLDVNINTIIKEGSTSSAFGADDGPPIHYKGFSDYKRQSKKWIDTLYAEKGWEVLHYILGKHAINPDFDYTLNYSIVPAVAYGKKNTGDYGSRFGVVDPIGEYKKHIEGKVLKNIGYEIIKWMGITPDGKDYTGVDVEAPILPGIGDDNVMNTVIAQKKSEKTNKGFPKLNTLKERISLDEEVRLLLGEDIKSDVIKSFSIRDSLNSKIWDNQEIKPEIRKKLLVIAKNFFKDLELEPNVKLNDITLTGSISNYNWSKFSDVDLHLIIDFKQVDDDSDFVRNYMLAKKTIWNNKHDITIYGFPVEVYVENVGDPHVASGLYSILKDEWIVVPKKKELQIDLQDIRSKAEGYLGSIPVLQKMMKEKKYDEVVEMVEKIQDKLKRMRSSGLEKGGEFSVENLAFKALRRSPFIEQILDMKRDAYDKKMTMEERISLDEEVKLLIEGGAYGHMNHPFDDKNITFSDLKQIIINGLGGTLNREDGVTEKLDGQNLMVSWVNGKLVTARNKGQLKNFGSSAMDIKGVASKFSGRGDIRDAFVFAMKDLNKSIGSLSDKQKEKIFDNGKRWMNLEIMYPRSVNVIDYDKTQIVFHGTLEYNESGTAIGQPKDSARMLAGMIKQVNQHIQKHYNIGKPQFLTVPKVQDFSKKKKVYLNRLKKLQNQYKLKDNDSLSKYHQSFWEEFIFNSAKQMKYKIPNKILVNLTKRWAFSDKSYKIPMIKKDIKDKKFLDWVLSFDKNDHTKRVKDNMKPFEILFFDVGAEILKNISGYLAASPEKAVQKIRKDVINAIKTVKSGGDIKKIETLKHQLDKLNKIGGLSAIVPSEGIVFKYKGNTYKFTGAFAPVNQIVGLLNF
jgi:predicted kinase